ncbi:MAG: SDR family NAD(P)-dependent oxidoreductase, partial [Cyanobacteria bacterium P01_F01_bin.42]
MNVLVVGATRGIGLGFVKHFLHEKPAQTLFATYRKPETAETLMALGQQHNALSLIQWDVERDQDFVAGVEQIQQSVDKLDLVIYCAGILHQSGLSPEKSLRQITREGLNQYFQVNTIGGILLAKHLQ